MFSENPGPTALRRDLVRALSLADADVRLTGEDGSEERSTAALGGVWNGSKGYVAILIRSLDLPKVRRFTYANPLDTEDALSNAIEEGLAFLEGMGFCMDPHEFTALEEAAQNDRLQAWDVIRKPVPPTGERPVVRADPDADTAVEEPPTQAGNAVLGRVAVVRGAELARARLLSQY